MLVRGLPKRSCFVYVIIMYMYYITERKMTLMYLRKLITICVPKVGMQMCMLIKGIHKINENSIPTSCVDPGSKGKGVSKAYFW